MDVGFTRIWNLLGAQYQTRCPRVFTLTLAHPATAGCSRPRLASVLRRTGGLAPLPGDEGTYSVTDVTPWLAALNRHLANGSWPAYCRGSAGWLDSRNRRGPAARPTSRRRQGMKELLANLPARLPLPEDQTGEIAPNAGNDWQNPAFGQRTTRTSAALADFLHQIDPMSGGRSLAWAR